MATTTKKPAAVDTACPHCNRQIHGSVWKRIGATLMARAARKNGTRKPPNPPLLRPCPYCDAKLGMKAMRDHIVECPLRPAVRTDDQRDAERVAMGREKNAYRGKPQRPVRRPAVAR